ncbi:MAG TPA: Hsp70 family protein, partial [Thermoanaerobaculia bacterium]|nr:Hsp70 family protein [Thermoanaerobaculia bacterium]
MKAIGIDLGTTNSVAAYCEPGSKSPPRVLGTSAGESFTPSVVGARRSPREANGWEVLVGRAAANYAPRAPEETVFSIKRLMGRDFADPQVGKLRGRFGYRVVAGPGEDPRAHVELAGELWSPARISSRILEQIRLEAARDLGEVRQAVITVPAYFHEGQRAATREAGEAAGLLVKKIIDEPTAAAVAFGVEARPGEHHRLLVYDLGGGTFDISILQLVKDEEGHNHFEVLEIEGDAWLGGDDFDLSIVEKIIATVAGQTGEDPAVDRRFLLLAKEHAEKAKKALSQSEVTEIVIPAAYRSKSNLVVDVELGLERAELEQAIRPLVERSMALVQKALERQNLSREDISDVLLVGGSTLVPLVYRTVESFFGAGRVRRSLNPMECVALGASLLAASLRGVECPSCGTLNPESAERCGRPGCGASLASARAVSE